MTDDLIREEIAGVKEAISRLPQEVQDKRYFRIKRVRPPHLGLTPTEPAGNRATRWPPQALTY